MSHPVDTNSAFPSVSVIIPTHARPSLLREALESVLSQTRTPSEILVVDDAGDEETREALESLRSSHPSRALKHIRNLSTPGPSASRNLGAKHACGELLVFLDDDDLWEPAYLEHVCDLVRRTGRPIVIGGQRRLEDGVVSDWRLFPENVRLDDLFAYNLGVQGSDIVVSRDAFWAIGGFDEQLPRTEDKDFLFRLLSAGFEYRVLPEPRVVHRVHPGPRLTDDPRLRWPFYHKHKRAVSRRARRTLRTIIIRQELRRAERLGRRRIDVVLRVLARDPLVVLRAPLYGARWLRQQIPAQWDRGPARCVGNSSAPAPSAPTESPPWKDRRR